MKNKIFYGWFLLFVCVLVQAYSFGLTLYSYSLIAGALEEEFSVSRSRLMMGVSGLLLMMAFISPKIGSLMDRLPMRIIMIVGAIAMGSGYLLASYAPNIWLVAASYTVFIAIGLSTLGPLCTSTLLARWFNRHRGIVLGIAGLGSQLGGLFFPPLLAWLIEAFDWRIALRLTGAGIIITLPLIAYFFIVDHPGDKGLTPDGDATADADADDNGSHPISPMFLSTGMMLRSVNFWYIVIIFSVFSIANTIIQSNLGLVATDAGISRENAAILISVLALAGMISSPVLGRLADYLDGRWVMAGMSVVTMLSALFYIIFQSYQALLVNTFAIGFALGGIMPMWGVMIGRLFSIENFGKVMGMTAMFLWISAAASPLLAGAMYDASGSYRIVFTFLSGLMFFSIFLAFFSGSSKGVND